MLTLLTHRQSSPPDVREALVGVGIVVVGHMGNDILDKGKVTPAPNLKHDFFWAYNRQNNSGVVAGR